MSLKPADCAAIHRAMCEGGFLDAVVAGGPDLARVRAYVESFSDPAAHASADPLQQPDYPLFPGLQNMPFHDPGSIAGVEILERNANLIRAEWQALADADFLDYRPPPMQRRWQAHLLHYMGVDMQTVSPQCTRTHALLRQLPRVCVRHAWGDALFSVQGPNSHLHAHCSVDNLRVRCHLGLQVPDRCAIRVGRETRRWQSGKALVFEDSFEHEVWNEDDVPRALLIVDFWHPDLTPIEIEALTAGFCRATVRGLFMFRRLEWAHSVPLRFVTHLEEQLLAQELEPARTAFWPEPRAMAPRTHPNAGVSRIDTSR